MFDNQIIPPNEKLKKIRQILRATQDEIAEGICTKNNISQIENNKQKLTANLAIGIAENLNKIAKAKGIALSPITVNDLIKDEDSQANYIFRNSIMKELKEINEIELFEKKLHEAENIIENYNISDKEKLELYKLAADFYYHQHIYTKSEEMCNKGLKVDITLKNITEEANLYIFKSRNSIETQRYSEALEQLEYAEKLNKRIGNNSFFEKIFFIRALTNKKLGNYDEALKYLDILKNKFEIEDKVLLLKVNMVYANCLSNQHRFDEAEKKYIETLELGMKFDYKDFIAMAYRNLSELYLLKGDYKSAGRYIKDSLICSPNNEYIGEILYFAAKVFENLNEDVEGYLLKALVMCEKNDKENLDLIEKIIYELILIYISKEDEKNIMLIAKKAELLNIDCCLIYLELVEYYRERNKEKSINLNKKIIGKVKRIKNFF
ncbi:tetratricopeptide repeat protein [Clostridium saccharoperbutylacetonicum]|uniref:tetratricopeptide repeat protein n=1 Tax=Clostridium saccharoperbutylacetonicum TaxID=36745 RepID=UPI0039EAEE77